MGTESVWKWMKGGDVCGCGEVAVGVISKGVMWEIDAGYGACEDRG